MQLHVSCARLSGMTGLDPEYLQRFSDALVSEIKAEMGRRDLSSRALGRLIDRPSSYMSDRLDGGSRKTGKRVILHVKDLALIAHALDQDPAELLARSRAAVEREDELAARRGRKQQTFAKPARKSARHDPEKED